MRLKIYFILVFVFFVSYIKSYSQIDSLVVDTINDSTLIEKKDKDKQINYSIDFFSFFRSLDFRDEKGSINLNNEVAQLDYFDYGIYLRPDITFEKNRVKLSIKPRYNLELDQYNSKYILDDAYFQELMLNYNLSNKSSVHVGRAFKNIGSSNIVNPSNVFFFESVSLNPKLELRPMDFFEYKYSFSHKWKAQLIANIGKGESNDYDYPFFEFFRKYAIQLDNYGESSQYSFIFALDENKRYDFGFNGQRNMNDALLVWVDGALNYNPNRFYPLLGHSTNLINYEMTNGDRNNILFFSTVAGASYTFEIGPTLSLEYYFNGKGYDQSTSKIYYNMISTSSDYNFDITKQLAILNLGRSINNGLHYLRKNYLLSQFGQNDFLGKINYFFRYAYCFDDNSNQLSSLIEWNINDYLEFHSELLYNIGGINTGFNRLIKNQIMCGIIYKL